jgi:hypothetical protein
MRASALDQLIDKVLVIHHGCRSSDHRLWRIVKKTLLTRRKTLAGALASDPLISPVPGALVTERLSPTIFFVCKGFHNFRKTVLILNGLQTGLSLPCGLVRTVVHTSGIPLPY